MLITSIHFNEIPAEKFATFAAACTAGETLGKSIVVSSAMSVDDDLTIDRSLVIKPGSGRLTIASGKILTINGPFQAGLSQCFDGDGSVVFGAGSVTEAYPEWWGGDLTKACSSYDVIGISTDVTTTGVTIAADKTVVGRGGTIIALGATSRGFTVVSGAVLTMIGVALSGGRPTLDSNTTNSGIVVDNGVVKIDFNCEIYNFAGSGVYLVAGGSTDLESSEIYGHIHDNGTGIYTGDYEYTKIDGARVIGNGLNVSKTDWSGIWGPGTGYGVYGRLANTALINCTINANAIGVFVNSIGGSNPDHNKIANNTINHNYAAGMVLRGLQSYETVIGNTILSNVTRAEAPTVIYAPRDTSVDMALEDIIGTQFIGNDIGPGSDTIGPPIFGAARCRWIANNFVYYPPTELRHPETGSSVYDYYGYLKNGDNYFDGNMYRNESIAGQKAVFLSDSVRSVELNAIQSAGAGAGSGGGFLYDNVPYKVSYSNGWVSVGGAIESWYMKTGKRVDLYIYATAPANPALAVTTIPAGFRPIGTVQVNAAVSNSLTHTYATVYPDGTVTFTGAVGGGVALMHCSFLIGY